MNIREFLLDRGADGDLTALSDGYLKEALALADIEEQHAALIPSVRSMVSTIASSLRKAQRGGGPVQKADDSQVADGGTVQPRHDSQAMHGGLADPVMAWVIANQGKTYWVPGVGRKVITAITADEWDAVAGQFENQARGVRRVAQEARDCAARIRLGGATCLGDLL